MHDYVIIFMFASYEGAVMQEIRILEGIINEAVKAGKVKFAGCIDNYSPLEKSLIAIFANIPPGHYTYVAYSHDDALWVPTQMHVMFALYFRGATKFRHYFFYVPESMHNNTARALK